MNKQTKICLLILAFFCLTQELLLSQNKNKVIHENDIKLYPTQISKITLEESGWLTGLIIHTDKKGKGKFQIRIFGHEAGSHYPTLKQDLIDPIFHTKERNDDGRIVIRLQDSIYLDNDQFFVEFQKSRGRVQPIMEDTISPDICVTAQGGSYNPTILLDKNISKKTKQQKIKIEGIFSFDKKEAPLFEEIIVPAKNTPNLNGKSIAWADINDNHLPELLLDGKLYEYNQEEFQIINDTLWSEERKTLAGNALVDIDNDGDMDIILFGKNNSYILEKEEGRFIRHNILLPPLRGLEGFSFGDLNYDGLPDMLLVQVWAAYPKPEPNFLYLNNGNFTFTDITQKLYPEHNGTMNFPSKEECITTDPTTCLPESNQNKRSRVCQFIDCDMDGDLDIYIGNYFIEKDEFWINDGDLNFMNTIENVPFDKIDSGSNHTTGVEWRDFDNDGDFDVLISRLSHPGNYLNADHQPITLYKKEGKSLQYVETNSGLQYEETHAGCFFADIDNNGLSDILTTAYYECRYSDLYTQKQDHSFKNKTHNSGLYNLTGVHDGAAVDFNLDGNIDLSFGSRESFRLFKNIIEPQNNWIKVKLKGDKCNTHGIGSTVKLYTDSSTYTQQVICGKGQMMQSPYLLHFGLPNSEKINKIEVLWYGGENVVYFPKAINDIITLHENEGNFVK